MLQNEISVFIRERVISLQPDYTNPVVGNVDHDYLEVNFDHEWDGLDKRVTFYGNGKESITLNLDENDRVTVPWEILKYAGLVGLTFVGSENGIDRLVTIDLEREKRLRVVASGEDLGVSPTEPSKDLYEQMKDLLEEARKTSNYEILSDDELRPNGIPNLDNPIEGVIYYAPIPEADRIDDNNNYVGWVWLGSKWNRLGSQTINIEKDEEVKSIIDNIFNEGSD